MTTITNKEKHSSGADLQLKGLVHHHHSGKHSNTQADMVLEQ